MGQSKIVTIGPVFILSDVFLAVAVVIAKAPQLFLLYFCFKTVREHKSNQNGLSAVINFTTPYIPLGSQLIPRASFERV